VDQAVLTGRAFTLLSRPVPDFEPPDAEGLPEAVRLEQQTHAHRLELALDSRSSTMVRKAVLAFMDDMTPS
jgi:hypothetical protein